MSRRRDLREIRTAELHLARERLAFQTASRDRLAWLRNLHPGWLVGSGFALGFVTERIGTPGAQGGTTSSLVAGSTRLLRLAAML